MSSKDIDKALDIINATAVVISLVKSASYEINEFLELQRRAAAEERRITLEELQSLSQESQDAIDQL